MPSRVSTTSFSSLNVRPRADLRDLVDTWEEPDTEEGAREEARERYEASVCSRVLLLDGSSRNAWTLWVGDLGAGTTVGAWDCILDKDMREACPEAFPSGVPDALL